jgi:polyhydroxybutyrate depolymerase
MRVLRWFAASLLVAGCTSDEGAATPVPIDAGRDATGDVTVDVAAEAPAADDGGREVATDGPAISDAPVGGDRPVQVHVPPGYVPGVPAPLVLLLHGYTASGFIEESYLNFTAVSDAKGFLYAYPDGTTNASGERFWNATDACCDLGGSMVDDSKYLHDLIGEIEARYTVDPKKVFLVGHSNGGFMTYRMACDHADQIAAIASLAGAMFSDVTNCHASGPVAVLEIHGTADTVISYTGGAIGGHAYPGATTSVADWTTIDGCDAADAPGPSLDLDSSLPGSETTVAVHATGCKPGGHTELWTIAGGSHIPSFTPTFAPAVVDFLYAHPKP